MGWNRFGALTALVACAGILIASPATGDDDLPGRVGRVANLQGTLQHSPDESAGDWSPIGQNYPIAQGDNLFVERDGLAEVDYGGGQFRLADGTNLHVSRLDDRQLVLFVAAGRVIVRVRVLDADDSVRIDTPATQVALVRPGLYRIDVAAGSPLTSVVVREGEAQVTTHTGVQSVMPGQAASLTGVANELPVVDTAGGIDGFDTWSAARDRVYEAPRQNDYVSRQMIGQADLDAYGAWQSFPDYGAVWFPTVYPEWAPYRFGYWTWLSGWGYTWVDQAPWGYAPFHYGRWAYIAGRWGWCPGTFVARPLWAPALVAWYGGGAGVRGHGPVYGWVPLGWREPFIPWWNRCTDRCYARYNRPYAVNVAERRNAPPTHYANWRVQGGLTAVPGAALMAGAPVAANRIAVRSDAAMPLARPPAYKPEAPVRPVVRSAGALPPPASTLDAARVTVAPAGAASRGALAPVAPSTGYRAGAEPVIPAPRGAPVASPSIASQPRAPLRIDDGRSVLPPSQPTLPTSPAISERTFRTAPLPARPATMPVAPPVSPSVAPGSVLPAPVAPSTLPPRVPSAGAAPRSLPAPVPPAVVPAPTAAPGQVAPPPPLPQPVAPATAQRGAPTRVAPPNPGPNDRPN
jgi:hypothetical protein